MTRTPKRPNRPAWVADLSTEAIHAMAGHLRRVTTEADPSPAQAWLLERLLGELAHRNSVLPRDLWCWCDLCIDPVMGRQMAIDDLLTMTRRPHVRTVEGGPWHVGPLDEVGPFDD